MSSIRPLVSVVTVVFNGEKYLEETIQSVINQTYDNFEYIIIDGGSTDGTIDIIKKYEDKIAYWISEPDRGIYDAWNKALKAAAGEWIMFLGADDVLMPEAIDRYIKFILTTPKSIEYVSAKINLVNENNIILNTIGKEWEWKTFRNYMNIAHVGSLHHRGLFQKYGLFDVSYKIAGDYEFLLRAKDKLNAGFMGSIVARMRVGGVSTAFAQQAIEESKNAKIKNAAKYIFIVHLDKYFALIKYQIRQILDKLSKK